MSSSSESHGTHDLNAMTPIDKLGMGPRHRTNFAPLIVVVPAALGMACIALLFVAWMVWP